MQQEKKKLSLPRKIARVTLKVILYVFLFIVLIFLLILTPPVQKFLTAKVQNYLETKLQTKVRIGRIGFGLSGNINLLDVYIEDKTKDTLVSGGAIKAHLNYLKLLSNEVEVKDIELQNITAKVKRILPDTVFNYQFIVDAFVGEQTKNPDTAKSAPMKLSISDVTLDNVNLTYTDVITGNDLFTHIGYATTTIDSLDLYNQNYSIPTLIVRNTQARMKQMKPLVEPKPMMVDIQQAQTPAPMHLNIGSVDLSKVAIQFDNDVSALYSNINVGSLKLNGKLLDLTNNKIYFSELDLGNTAADIRFGKKPMAVVTKQEVNQKVEAQKSAGWDVRIDKIRLDNNNVVFDDDNQPKQPVGMDYSHLNATGLTLYMDRFVMNNDSIGGLITKGSMKEKSGFKLDALEGDLLYANTQSFLKNLYIKTPGTEIRKNLVLQYASYDALVKDFAKTNLNIELTNSQVQVKDILTFAPQLHTQPAFSRPNDIWKLNIVGNGNMDQLSFKALQFDGFRDTHLSASGTLTNLTNPNIAGGNFAIYNLHTSQADIKSLSGQSLPNTINLPQSFDLSGTVAGNAGRINTNLNLNSSDGFVGLNGSFANVMNPTVASYSGTLRTNNLQVGRILRQEDQMGSITATFSFNGKGLDPNTMDTRFAGNIASAGYNKYQYHDIKISGTLKKTVFDVTTDVHDPNISLNLTASGNMTENGSLKVHGMVDSVKLEPLHFTTEPMVFRGKIDGNVANMNPNYLDADLLITKALFVTSANRMVLDSIELIAGRTDTAQYIRFKSDIVNAQLSGQYRLADLGNIFMDNIQPYFSAGETMTPTATVQPYNIHFTADMAYTPMISALVPDLKKAEPIHARGSLATGQGLNIAIAAPYILYQTNELSNATVNVNTDASGMHIATNVAHIKSGSSFDIYNARINATALHNNIDFSVGVDDKHSRHKYVLTGNFSQPSAGDMVIHLNPDSLMLNYDKWSVAADNSITISSNAIVAKDFTLSKGNQQISLQSLAGNPQPLQVSFGNFKLATITGFIKADSVLIDGTTNGTVTFTNLTQQPLFTSNLTISDLSLRQDTIGNVNIQASSTASNVYKLTTTITGKGNDVELSGTASPKGSDVAMDMTLDVRQLQLHSMEGALKDFITSANGNITGNIKIQGTTMYPKVTGKLNFDKATISTVALGGPLTIDNESLNVTEDGFKFNDFTVRDSANHPLRLNGEVLTANFINYEFDLDVDADNFRIINTTKKQNDIYYGSMYLTTSLHITGTEQNPAVDGAVTVLGGTNFSVVIPQTNPAVVSREGVVEFVDFKNPENDSLFRTAYDSLNVSKLAGFDIAANITVKKEAKFGIVIDETNGDFVNLQGEALLSAGIDPSGKISLTGSYVIDQGYYQLTYNFLQRRFDIQKGSKITWFGDMTSAQLDVSAIYVANTAPLDLVSNYISASNTAIRNTYLQKLPFQVVLKMGGELMKPVITFDIVLPTDKNYNVSNDIITNVDTRLTQLRQEPSELNKQVFSLLLLGRFVGENPFQSSGGGFSAESYARASVSKLLTEQLNSLAQGLIAGVDLTFDVASTDDYTTGELRNRTDLNVGLSKRLMNDRLTVTVGSNFELEGPQQTNQQSNNIAGNIAVNYQLSRDGRYMLRLYRKNDYYGVVEGYIIETGLNFIITLDYDKFAEILHRKRNKVENGKRQTDKPADSKPADTKTDTSDTNKTNNTNQTNQTSQ